MAGYFYAAAIDSLLAKAIRLQQMVKTFDDLEKIALGRAKNCRRQDTHCPCVQRGDGGGKVLVVGVCGGCFVGD
jgi:hypothetical protein